MMKRVYTCDHCGKELDEMKDYIDITIDDLDDYIEADLCSDCYHELSDIVSQHFIKKNDTSEKIHLNYI